MGERGVRLSGGQRQRLILARALLLRSDLLILDEPTNALDSITEHALQRALTCFARGRTVIMVAHRISTIERADHILVLDRGRLAEQGNLSTLLARNGLLARMYKLQHLAQVSEHATTDVFLGIRT